jgi:hypothetical protein
MGLYRLLTSKPATHNASVCLHRLGCACNNNKILLTLKLINTKNKQMKKIISSLTIIALATMVMLSCKKSDTTPAVDDSYDSFVKANTDAVQTFTIDAATGGTITAKRGTKITFPPNAFANPDNSITTGNVLVTVKEALLKKQWILESLSTTTSTEMLVSGGMLDIAPRRQSDGVEVKLAAAMLVPTPSMVNVVKVEVPRVPERPDTLRLFLPANQAAPSPNPPSSWAASYYPFGNGSNSYIFQLPQFRWVNCDGLANQPGVKTTIKVTPDLTAVTGATGVQVMLVFRNISTVITLPPSGSSMQSYPNSIPVGSVADVVCIGKDGAGKIIFKVLPGVVFTANANIAIPPVKEYPATVKAYLDSIN